MSEENIKLVFDKLDNFPELYLVGGALRNILLNIPVTDYDFATPYTPKEIKVKLSECGIDKIYTVGEKFGTIAFMLNDLKVEITTFRGEQYNYVHRKPEVSYVSSIEEDVSRRDFTINAFYISSIDFMYWYSMGCSSAYFLKNDYLRNCVTSLEKKEVKTVGNPAKRFKEDPLRMLRAVRFAIKLGFTIEDKTFQMIQRLRIELLKVSVERWNEELDKILKLPSPDLTVLGASNLLNIMIPELSYQIGFQQNSKYHKLTLWEHTIKVVKATPPDNINLRWAALLHDIGKPFVMTVNKRGGSNYIGHEVMSGYLVEQVGTRLKWANNRIKEVREIVEHHLNKYCILKDYDDSAKKC